MERQEFCKGAKCAKVTIQLEGEKPIILVSKFPSLIVESSEKEEQKFVHSMDAPIEREFPFIIEGIEFLGGSWSWNKDFPSLKIDCPMPGTYPVIDTNGIDVKEKVTDMYWRENKLFCYFDGKLPEFNFYSNNSGRCAYRVFGKKAYYKFSDRQGILYESRLQKKLTYSVECNACCKDNEILCDSPHYPGYSCYPIPPMNSKLLESKNNIARFWR